MATHFIVFSAIVLFAFAVAYAHDPSPLQDFCVAVNDSAASAFVNGKIFKNPQMVKAKDFFFHDLNKSGNTSNPLGSAVTAVNVNNLAGLNTLGISLVRIDFAPYGLNPPHTHPRATEGVHTLLIRRAMPGNTLLIEGSTPHRVGPKE